MWIQTTRKQGVSRKQGYLLSFAKLNESLKFRAILKHEILVTLSEKLKNVQNFQFVYSPEIVRP